MTPEQSLLNAVVLQAAQDYRKYRLAAAKHKDRLCYNEAKLKEVEKFFSSGEASKFTKADTDVILEKLQKESLAECKRLYAAASYRKNSNEYRNKDQ